MQSFTSRSRTPLALVAGGSLAAVSLMGCSTLEAVGIGAAGGAAGGAAIGSMSGDAGKGALIGAGVGALAGLLVSEIRKSRLEESKRQEVQADSERVVASASTKPGYSPSDSVVLQPVQKNSDGTTEYAVITPSASGGQPTVQSESVVIPDNRVAEIEQQGGVLDARGEQDLPVIGGKKVVFAS